MNDSDSVDPIKPLVESLLKELGEDPGRDGLKRTPERIAKSMRYLTRGYSQDPREILNDALFAVTYDELVIVNDLELYNLSDHHLRPCFGSLHVA